MLRGNHLETQTDRAPLFLSSKSRSPRFPIGDPAFVRRRWARPRLETRKIGTTIDQRLTERAVRESGTAILVVPETFKNIQEEGGRGRSAETTREA